VYLGTPAILTTWHSADLRVHPGTWTRTPISCGTQVEGEHRNGEHVWRQFTRDLARCRKALGADAVPVIRVHDLRHMHATLLLMSRVTSDASFRRIREPVWPAVLFTAGQAAAGRAMW
jgi:integrase